MRVEIDAATQDDLSMLVSEPEKLGEHEERARRVRAWLEQAEREALDLDGENRTIVSLRETLAEHGKRLLALEAKARER